MCVDRNFWQVWYNSDTASDIKKEWNNPSQLFLHDVQSFNRIVEYSSNGVYCLT